MRPEIKHARRITRRASVRPEHTTEDRDRAADWIEENVVRSERPYADWTVTEMAVESGWSRQHISNVLDRYFEPVRDSGGKRLEQIDADVSDEYRQGFVDGWEAAKDANDDA